MASSNVANTPFVRISMILLLMITYTIVKINGFGDSYLKQFFRSECNRKQWIGRQSNHDISSSTYGTFITTSRRRKQIQCLYNTFINDTDDKNNEESTQPTHCYNGPILPSDAEIIAGASLSELGLDLAIAASTVVPSGLGLYIRLSSPDINRVTVPALTLLCGYSRFGSFESADVGDKTVGFALPSADTAVFYDRRLMSIADALVCAEEQCVSGEETLDKSHCGLIGHEIKFLEPKLNDNDENMIINPVDDGFPRYFVPKLVNQAAKPEEGDYTIQNFGQFCNDSAWDCNNPPKDQNDYDKRSMKQNVIQLMWRMEYNVQGGYLAPSWPVSVFKNDVVFGNQDFMELGTQYGWKYWQQTVDLDKL